MGSTFQITFGSFTATGGYEQLEAMANFPNTIFEILSVAVSYAQPIGSTNDAVYADACGWNNDPADAHYKEGTGGNPGCDQPDNYSGGKAGGDPVTTTYTIKAITRAGDGYRNVDVHPDTGGPRDYFRGGPRVVAGQWCFRPRLRSWYCDDLRL